MSVMEAPPVAVRARLRRELAEVDARRVARHLVAEGYSPQDVARWGVTDSAPAPAAADVDPLDGFSGATPYEICERYAAGMIDRERLVDELARYPYVPTPRTESLADDLLMTPPGTWADVCDADRRGLIPEDVYGEVMARQDALGL